MKTEGNVSQNIYFLWPRELTCNNKFLVCAHKNKTLKMLSLTAENVSSALCSTINGTLLARERRNFCNLETCLSHDILWGPLQLADKSRNNYKS
jgi:hypothetical protein